MTYLDSFKRTHDIGTVFVKFDELKGSKSKILIAGRIMAKRVMGKVVFLTFKTVQAECSVLVQKAYCLKKLLLT